MRWLTVAGLSHAGVGCPMQPTTTASRPSSILHYCNGSYSTQLLRFTSASATLAVRRSWRRAVMRASPPVFEIKRQSRRGDRHPPPPRTRSPSATPTVRGRTGTDARRGTQCVLRPPAGRRSVEYRTGGEGRIASHVTVSGRSSINDLASFPPTIAVQPFPARERNVTRLSPVSRAWSILLARSVALPGARL